MCNDTSTRHWVRHATRDSGCNSSFHTLLRVPATCCCGGDAVCNCLLDLHIPAQMCKDQPFIFFSVPLCMQKKMVDRSLHIDTHTDMQTEMMGYAARNMSLHIEVCVCRLSSPHSHPYTTSSLQQCVVMWSNWGGARASMCIEWRTRLVTHEQLSSVIQKVQNRSDDLSSQTCHQWCDFAWFCCRADRSQDGSCVQRRKHCWVKFSTNFVQGES